MSGLFFCTIKACCFYLIFISFYFVVLIIFFQFPSNDIQWHPFLLDNNSGTEKKKFSQMESYEKSLIILQQHNKCRSLQVRFDGSYIYCIARHYICNYIFYLWMLQILSDEYFKNFLKSVMTVCFSEGPCLCKEMHFWLS